MRASSQHYRVGAFFLLSFLTGSLVIGFPSQVRAQLRGVDTRFELGARRLAVSPLEMRALLELGSLVHGGNRNRQDRALATARSAASSADARFALATYELEIGKQRGNDQMRVRALNILIASDLLAKDRINSHLTLLGQLAFQSGDLAGARGAWERLSRQSPDRHDALAALAQVDLIEAKWRPAMNRLNRAIDLAEESGTRAPESWYQQRLSAAQQGTLVADGLDAAKALVTVFPTQSNWRAALLVTRDLAASSGPAEINLLRLMRYAGVLQQSAEFLRLAQLLRAHGEAVEALDTLHGGIAAGLIDVQRSPAKEIVAEVRRALIKPSASVTTAPAESKAAEGTRLGLESLKAGRRDEAVRLLRQAASAPVQRPYSDIAGLWLIFLLQHDNGNVQTKG